MNATKSNLELNAAAALAGLSSSPVNDTPRNDGGLQRQMSFGENKEITFPMKVSEEDLTPFVIIRSLCFQLMEPWSHRQLMFLLPK